MEGKLYRAETKMSPVIYKDFYKFYYRERLKVFRIVSTICAVMALTAAVFLYYGGYHPVWPALLLWLGVFLLVYPNTAYRRPFKRDRDKKQTTIFSFYETYVAEKTNGERSDYDYNKLLRVYETPKYIYIYHAIDSVSIVDKSAVREGSEALAEFLKARTEYKRVKKDG